MKYVSTRGGVSDLSFCDAVMMGLASDGGLLIPESIPDISAVLPQLVGLSYNDLALEIVGRFIDDVPPEGGAFKIWPGSHKRLYKTFQMQYDQPRIPYYEHMPSFKGLIQSPEYEKEIKLIMKDTLPIDCWGSSGDVVLWHHRLAHMAGHNYSDKIRQAVLCDFIKKDLDISRTLPPQENMWQDWSEDLNAAPETYSDEMARSQKLID